MPSTETQFKKGNNANPKGKPKGSKSFKNALRKVLEADTVEIRLLVNGEATKTASIKIEGKESNFYDAIAAVQVQQAMKGNLRAAKDIIDRMEGSASQSIKMQSEVSGALSVMVQKRVINSKTDIRKKTITTTPIGETTTTTEETTEKTAFDIDEVF